MKMTKTELYISTMGVLLIVTQMILVGFILTGYSVSVGGILAIIVSALGGLAAVLRHRKEKLTGIAFCLFVIGLSTILSDFEMMFSTEEGAEPLLSLLYVAAGAVLVYYSYSLYLGLRTGSAKGIICLAVLALMELSSFVFAVRRGDTLNEWHWFNLVLAVDHVIFIFILTRPEMMLPTFLKRLRTNSDTLYDSMVSDPEVYVDRKDVDRLTDIADGPEWTHLESGPIERESVVDLHGQRVGTELLLQIWKGDERLHLTVRSRGTDSYGIAMSMVVDQTVLLRNEAGDVTKIRLYGQEGVFADIRVSAEDTRKGLAAFFRAKADAAGAEDQVRSGDRSPGRRIAGPFQPPCISGVAGGARFRLNSGTSIFRV